MPILILTGLQNKIRTIGNTCTKPFPTLRRWRKRRTTPWKTGKGYRLLEEEWA